MDAVKTHGGGALYERSHVVDDRDPFTGMA